MASLAPDEILRIGALTVLSLGNIEFQLDDLGLRDQAKKAMKGCHVCHVIDPSTEEHVLLCDGCDLEYHMFCLSPPLVAVPSDDWFCPVCVKKAEDEKRKAQEAQEAQEAREAAAAAATRTAGTSRGASSPQPQPRAQAQGGGQGQSPQLKQARPARSTFKTPPRARQQS